MHMQYAYTPLSEPAYCTMMSMVQCQRRETRKLSPRPLIEYIQCLVGELYRYLQGRRAYRDVATSYNNIA